MSLTRKERRAGGFTLIELMIVLFILGLLAALVALLATGECHARGARGLPMLCISLAASCLTDHAARCVVMHA